MEKSSRERRNVFKVFIQEKAKKASGGERTRGVRAEEAADTRRGRGSELGAPRRHVEGTGGAGDVAVTQLAT